MFRIIQVRYAKTRGKNVEINIFPLPDYDYSRSQKSERADKLIKQHDEIIIFWALVRDPLIGRGSIRCFGFMCDSSGIVLIGCRLCAVFQ